MTRRRHRWIEIQVVGALAVFAALMGACNAATGGSSGEVSSTVPQPDIPSDFDWTVTKVTDGDTIHVSGPDSDNLTIRIIGINTPEVYGPKAGECNGYGKTSSAIAKKVLLYQKVALTPDNTQADTDRFGRTLRYVDVRDLPTHEAFGNPSTDYSTYAAYIGSAHKFEYEGHPGKLAPGIRQAEAHARDAHLGVWAAC